MLLQTLPPVEALNPEIAYWIIGTLLATIATMVLFMKWVFTKAGNAGIVVWKKVENLHKEGIEELRNIKDTQTRIEVKQDAIKLSIDETKYAIQTLNTKVKCKESA